MKRILILSIIPIVMLACGNNENIDRVVTPEPERIRKPIINLSAPVINKILVPDQVHAGARIKLEVVAEDPDGNGLTYNWEAPAGSLLYNKNKSMSIAIWTAPIDVGIVTITVKVNDGIHESTQSADVRVIPALIVPGKEAGGIRLGDKLYEVIDLYGEPSHQIDVVEVELVGHQEIPAWDTKLDWNNDGLTVYFRSNRVLAVVISAPNTAITAAGNGIGSDCDEIRNELDRKFGRDHVVGGSNIEDDYYAYVWPDYGIEIRCRLSIVTQIVISKVFPDWYDSHFRI